MSTNEPFHEIIGSYAIYTEQDNDYKRYVSVLAALELIRAEALSESASKQPLAENIGSIEILAKRIQCAIDGKEIN
ncbi:hypothetical protein [Spartinivicinus ruber]|uniref:hypothetical protein n=1 Tax=Spartinivicinus ruber TaxID=2683272 RepID=UPI0013D11376|nr:hypothetical protein [Spartinivicinus ruber]